MRVKPPINLDIKQFNLIADNLRMVKGQEHTLPSPISASGISIGGGKLKLNGRVNLIREIPDADISFSLEGVDITALNTFTQEYAKIDFKKGQFDFFSEFAIADGYLKGYLKPLISDSELIEPVEPFLTKVWEGFVGFFQFALKNHRTDTLATKVPLEGDLNDPNTKIWPAITGIFRNAWVEAFNRSIDNEVEYKDAFVKGKKKDKD